MAAVEVRLHPTTELDVTSHEPLRTPVQWISLAMEDLMKE